MKEDKEENGWFHEENDLVRVQMQWMRVPPTTILRNDNSSNTTEREFHPPMTLPISMTDLLGEPNLLSLWHNDDDDESSSCGSSYSSTSSSIHSNDQSNNHIVSKEEITKATMTKEEWTKLFQSIWQNVEQIYTNLKREGDDYSDKSHSFSFQPFRNIQQEVTLPKHQDDDSVVEWVGDFLTQQRQQKEKTSRQTLQTVGLLFLYVVSTILPSQNFISSFILIVLHYPRFSPGSNNVWLLSKVANQIIIPSANYCSKQELNQQLQPLLISDPNITTIADDDSKREAYMAIAQAFVNHQQKKQTSHTSIL